MKRDTAESETPPEEKQDRLQDSSTGTDRKFNARKYISGGITWFVCAALLVPCYLLTKIWAMAALVPIMIFLGIEFIIKGQGIKVCFNSDTLLIQSMDGFVPDERRIKINEIKSLRVETSCENNTETIQFIEVVLEKEKIPLPDIDDKTDFLKFLNQVKSNLVVDKNDGFTDEQKKDLRRLQIFSLIIAVIGSIAGSIYFPSQDIISLLLNGVKGGVLAAGLGIPLWFTGYNLKRTFKRGEKS